MTYRVTMTPDTSSWAEDDLRWAAGFHCGLWQHVPDAETAAEHVKIATDLGWSAIMQPMEET